MAHNDEFIEDQIAAEEHAKEIQEENKRLRQWVSDLQGGLYINCVYCGYNYGPKENTPAVMADVLKEHIEKCPKHPLSQFKKCIEEGHDYGDEPECSRCGHYGPEDDEHMLKLRIKQLEREMNMALDVLKPTMPESGLVDACRQRMQAYISEQDNVEELQNALLLIGDKAVVDWDDKTVGQVDAAVPKVTKTYAEWAREVHDTSRKKNKRIEELEELILNSAPLHWVAHGDLDGAGEWEKRAEKLLKK